jgi:cytoskeleton protein RodZ
MSVGSELQKAREDKKISLQAVSQKTRIPVKYLEALEGDHFDLFPSQTHAKGFVRAYAKVVGLEAAGLMAQFKAQVEPVPAKITPPHPEVEVSSGFSWSFFPRKNRVPRRERISDEAFDPDLPMEEPGVVVRRQTSAAPVPSVVRSAMFNRRRWQPFLLPVFFLLLLGGVVFWAAPTASRFMKSWHWPSSPNPISTAVLPGLVIKDKYQHLILKGLDQSWILVTMDAGQSSSEFDLAPGQVKSYRALKSFKLKIGNAGGVDAWFNGKPLGVLGTTGQVVEISLPEDSASSDAGGS